jgi:hypothetical protein
MLAFVIHSGILPVVMPRLTYSTYSAQHDVLHELWVRSDGRAFAVISPIEQWYLHEFFAVTITLSADGLREHRQLVTKHDPSLPHRAGRALKKLNERLAVEAEQSEATSVVAGIQAPWRRTYCKNTDRVIRVKSVVHPEPDAEKLARALLDLASEMAQKQREERDDQCELAVISLAHAYPASLLRVS